MSWVSMKTMKLAVQVWQSFLYAWLEVESIFGQIGATGPEGLGSFRTKIPKFCKFCPDKNGGVSGNFRSKHLWELSGVLCNRELLIVTVTNCFRAPTRICTIICFTLAFCLHVLICLRQSIPFVGNMMVKENV